jgi:radical SAM protein
MDFDAAPILVFWETTRACLLACRHCRAEAVERPLPGQLSTEEGLAFIRDLTRFGPRPPVLILTGGDALMRPDLFDLAGYARSLGIPIGLAPSVTPLLTPTVLEQLKRLEVKSVSISLDGATAPTHEGIRRVPGHFEQTLAALDLLVREGFAVQVNTAVMRDNVEELADAAALLRSLGVGVWEVFFLVKVGRGIGVEELTPEDNEDVAHFLFEASRYGLTVRTVEAPFFRRVVAWRTEAGTEVDAAEAFSLGPLYRRLAARLRERLGEPEGAARAQSAGTRDGKGIVFVAHDGDVYPAGFLPLPLGNVRERSVVDIYRNHPLLRAIREARFAGRCGICEHRDLCGGSRARAFAASGDPLGQDPACPYVPSATRGSGARDE